MTDKRKKRYYWLKLKEDFFEEDTIDWLEDQENGKEYSLIYLKLCLKSLKTDGYLARNVGELIIPYDEKAIAKMTKSSIDTVLVAMELFKKIGLIDVLNNGELYMTQLSELTGSETESARQKRLERAKLIESATLSQECLKNVAQSIEKELDIEKELELENIGSSEPCEKDSQSSITDEFETIWESYPKNTNKKKAKLQYSKKRKEGVSLEIFTNGFEHYLEYIRVNEWYSPQDLFRWIRDDRFNDKYDLTVKTKNKFSGHKQPIRKESLPDWVDKPVKEAPMSEEDQTKFRQMLVDMRAGGEKEDERT